MGMTGAEHVDTAVDVYQTPVAVACVHLCEEVVVDIEDARLEGTIIKFTAIGSPRQQVRLVEELQAP